jgi:DNA repair exonuclease SbcCD ATPase subunit
MLSLSVRINSLDESIRNQQHTAWKEPDLSARLNQNKRAVDELSKNLEQKKQAIQQQQEDLTRYKMQDAESKQIQQRITDSKIRLEKIREELKEAQRMSEREAYGIREKAADTRKKIAEIDSLLGYKDRIISAKQDADKLSVKIAETDKSITGVKDCIQKKAHEIYILNMQHKDELSNEKEVLSNLGQNEADLAARIKSEEETLTRTVEAAEALNSDPELMRIKYEIKTLESKIADLDKRDPVCQSTTCAFIVGALDAQEKLPGLAAAKEKRASELIKINNNLKTKADQCTRNIEELTGSLKTVEKNRKSFFEICCKNQDKRLAAIKQLEAGKALLERDANALAEAKKDLQGMYETAEKTARKIQDILVAEERKSTLQNNLNELSEMAAEKKRVFDLFAVQKVSGINELEAEADALRKQIDNDLPEKITQAETGDKRMAHEITESEKNLADVTAEAAIIEKDIAEARKATEEKRKLEDKKNRLVKESSEWAYLKDACGADGLRALEIDSVAPGITHDANRLLEQAFGAWAMVDFRTQNDDGKEVLEPRVIDHDGDSVLIGNRSGGQQVWALKALRLAMTMISKKRSGKDFQTIFCDEDDAGLDIETAQNFTRLYRALMDMGGFKKCFFISHKPECIGLADRVVDLSKG